MTVIVFQCDDEQQQGQDGRVQEHGPEPPRQTERSCEERQVRQAELRVHQHRQEHQPGHHQHLHQAGETYPSLQEENHLR